MTRPEVIRLDKWLWFARFFKTRGLAAKMVGDGKVRVNGVRAVKPAHAVGIGDVLTFAQGDAVRVVELRACGTRRGPAPEAQGLYLDRSPPVQPAAPGFDPGHRPDRKQRQDRGRIDDLARRRTLE